MTKTNEQYDKIVAECRSIFVKKLNDYGASWRVLRLSSVTDQLFIKASRIRSIEMKGIQKVEDDIKSEFIGLINYSIIALIQSELGFTDVIDSTSENAVFLYDKHILSVKHLMMDKNHDYNEAWRNMRISSLTDIILVKINRIKQIEDNFGNTLISEGVEANYSDIINYSVFALIQISEKE